jgi:hypothetical protein
MDILRKLQAVKDAQAATAFSRLLWDAYTRSSIGIRVPLWLVTIAFFGVAAWDIALEIGRSDILAPALSVLYGIIGSAALESAYRRLIAHNKDLVKRYRKNRLFLRYLIFRENVPRQFRGDEQLGQQLRALLRSEAEIDGPSLFSNHPTSVALVAFLAAVISGGASQPVAWESGVMWWIVAFLALGLVLASRFGDFLNPSRRKDRELNQFLVWLAIDEQPRVEI